MKTSLLFLILTLVAVNCVYDKENEEEYFSAEEDENENHKIDFDFVIEGLKEFEIESAKKGPLLHFYNPLIDYLSDVHEKNIHLTEEMKQLMTNYEYLSSSIKNSNFNNAHLGVLAINEGIKRLRVNANHRINALETVVEWIKVRTKSENYQLAVSQLEVIRYQADTSRTNIKTVIKKIEQNKHELDLITINPGTIIANREKIQEKIQDLKGILLEHGFVKRSESALKETHVLLKIKRENDDYMAGDLIAFKIQAENHGNLKPYYKQLHDVIENIKRTDVDNLVRAITTVTKSFGLLNSFNEKVDKCQGAIDVGKQWIADRTSYVPEKEIQNKFRKIERNLVTSKSKLNQIKHEIEIEKGSLDNNSVHKTSRAHAAKVKDIIKHEKEFILKIDKAIDKTVSLSKEGFFSKLFKKGGH